MTNFTTDALLAKASKYPTTNALPRHTAEGQKLARMAGDAHNIVGKHDMSARKMAHKKLAQEHRDVVGAFKAAGRPDLAELNAHAAELHEHAADENSGTDGLNARGATQAAVDATSRANSATQVDDTPVAGVTWGGSVASAPVAKGDVVGHVFHGNQYAKGEIAAAAKELLSKSTKSDVSPSEMAEAHLALSKAHDVKSLTAKTKTASGKHYIASLSHFDAYNSWKKVAAGDPTGELTKKAQFDTLIASSGSKNADK